MTIIQALEDVLGVFPAEYEWLLYYAAILFFVIFIHWVFITISRFFFDYMLGRRK